jgi:Glycosyl transferase family 2
MASILLIVDGLTALESEFARICQQIIVISDRPANFIDIAWQVVPSISEIVKILPTVQTDFIAYLPCGIGSVTLPNTDSVQNYLAPLLPEVTLPQETAIEISIISGWIASIEIAKFALPQLKSWTILEIAQVLENAGIAFLWGGAATHNIPQGKGDKKINPQVLAIVTHYRCEAWLKRCLESLVNQTRKPDNIVVVDDGSDNPPISIVEPFPQVTLLASSDNVGTYRLIQQVITDTNYDAYLFQDADDWCSCDRLEKLLHALTTTSAELVGTQELRVYGNKITPVCYPLDVNAALKEKPGHPLIHPSSLVTRDLVMRLGGFATGLRFGGDTEFLLRASIAAKVVNIPYYCYYRRKRQGSLTTAVDTGLNSPARQELIKILKARALNNYAALKANQKPCLTPLTTASPIKLKYIAGLPWQASS